MDTVETIGLGMRTTEEREKELLAWQLGFVVILVSVVMIFHAVLRCGGDGLDLFATQPYQVAELHQQMEIVQQRRRELTNLVNNGGKLTPNQRDEFLENEKMHQILRRKLAFHDKRVQDADHELARKEQVANIDDQQFNVVEGSIDTQQTMLQLVQGGKRANSVPVLILSTQSNSFRWLS